MHSDDQKLNLKMLEDYLGGFVMCNREKKS